MRRRTDERLKELEGVLKELGVRAVHDTRVEGYPGRDGLDPLGTTDVAVSWPQAFNTLPFHSHSRGCSAPFWTWKLAGRNDMAHEDQDQEHDVHLFKRVAHLMRNPLPTIRSQWDGAMIKKHFIGVYFCN